MSHDSTPSSAGPRVDLIASLDGRLAELGRDLSDQELSKAEALIGLSNLMSSLAGEEGESQLRLEDEQGVCRALILDEELICIDLPQNGVARGQFRSRALASVRWLAESRRGQR